MYDHITASPFGDKTTILHPLYNIAVYLLYASTMVLVLHIVYRRTLDPLSHIPGPLFGSITNLYLLFYTLTLRRCKTLLRLSTTYGPVLRVAPNKVIFNAPEAANAIYRDHKMHKGPAYDMFRLDGGGLHTISTTKMEDHSRVRNSYAAHYTPVNVSKYSGTIYGTINKALAAFEAKSTRDGGEGVEVDTMVLFRHLMIDIACISLFGYKHVAVDNFINGIKDEFADAIGAWPRLSLFVSHLFPSSIHTPAVTIYLTIREEYFHSGLGSLLGTRCLHINFASSAKLIRSSLRYVIDLALYTILI